MKIKDLVRMPAKPRRVINLEDAVTSQQEEIISTFVLTKNTERILNRILGSIEKGRGEGFWLLGPYGSGKSHILSYMSILLKHFQPGFKVKGQLIERYSKLLSSKWLVINFSLTERDDFKATLFSQLEASLPGLYITSADRIVNTFREKNLQAINSADFEKFLAGEGYTLEKLIQCDPEIAAYLILEYFKKNGFLDLADLNDSLRPPVREGLAKALQTLPVDYKGIVIIIDELSHYLLKKREEQQLMRELEVLQSLGEAVRELPVWVISALQMSPMEIETDSEELRQELDKVSDRYTELVLAVTDIDEILNVRVAVKSEHAKAKIRELFRALKRDFPHLVRDYSEDEFVSFYPFHKQFISSLTRLAQFGSRERTIIEELWWLLADNLDRLAEELLTPDILFDRFEEFLLHSRFLAYNNLYYHQFLPLIEGREFKGDRILARKIIKVLIILKLCHNRGATPLELAHMLMEGLGLPVKTSIIYDEVAGHLEALMLLSRGKHLYCLASPDKGKRVYEIDPYKNYYSVEYEVRNLADNYEPEELHDLIIEFFSGIIEDYGELPVETGGEGEVQINWQYTRRQGRVVFSELDCLDTVLSRPLEPEYEFTMVIGFPVQNASFGIDQIIKKHQRYLVWEPGVIDEMAGSILRRYKAVKELLEERYADPSTDEEIQKNKQLSGQFEYLQKRLSRVLKNVYWKGRIVTPCKNIDDLKSYSSFLQLINAAAGLILDAVYPRFPNLSHNTGRYHTNKLIKEFVLEGSREQLTSEMTNIGRPLGIIEEREGKYFLKASGEYLKLIEELLKNEQRCSVNEEILPLLTGEPYGLTDYLVEVLLVTGIVKGEWRGRDGKGEIITGNNLDIQMVGSGSQSIIRQIRTVEKGDLLTRVEWDRIVKVTRVLFPDTAKDITRNSQAQDFIWVKLLEKQQETLEDLEQSIRVLTQLCKVLSRLDLIKKINEPLLKAHYLFDHDYYHSSLDSREGLTLFQEDVEKTYGNLEKFAAGIKQIIRAFEFVKRRLDQRLITAFKYLNKCKMPSRGYQQLKLLKTSLERRAENLNSLIYSPRALRGFILDFERFKRNYISVYCKEHEAFYSKVENFVSELTQLPEYETLSLLEKIKPIRVAYNLKPIKKYIDNFFPHNCQQDELEELLEREPRCSCGFNLGERFLAPELNKIKPMLRKGINEYLDQFNNTRRFRKFLETYADEHPDSILCALLEIRPGEIEKMLELVTPGLIEEINLALHTTIPVRVSYQEIVSQIAGSYPASRLDELVKRFRQVLDLKVDEAVEEFQEVSRDRIVLLVESEV